MRAGMRRAAGVLAACLFGATGCALVDPTTSEPSLIGLGSQRIGIEAPDTAAVGESFEVAFDTFGDGCTRSIARTDVRSTPLLIELRPYDETSRGTSCTTELRYLQHRVMVQFTRVGIGTIRVLGIQRPIGERTNRSGPGEVTRTLVVR